MKLSAFILRNYKIVGDDPVSIDIDNIVVLIGPNNVGKSTVLDAYEAFASSGTVRELSEFHNESIDNPITIEGVFTELTDEDLDVVGHVWKHTSTEYGECIRVRWSWEAPGQKGIKYSWDPIKSDWKKGGMGGWDTLIASRIPFPLRVRPDDSALDREKQITTIMTAAVKAALKDDSGKAAKAVAEIEALAKDLSSHVQSEIDEACNAVEARLEQVFSGHQVEFVAAAGKFEPDKIIGDGSHIRIKPPGLEGIPLNRQGTGIQRAFLWSALGALADLGHLKKVGAENPRILLIDEPESFLHPSAIRSARENLYNIAELKNWQVIASTHSPILVDVSKPHTSIVRVDSPTPGESRVFQTDKVIFDEDERTMLKMIRTCNPVVNEFFFADKVILVEGETEQVVLSWLLESNTDITENIHVVNCIGKANIPLFAKILNQFRSPYVVLHDSDKPKAKRKGNWITNPMWTMNSRIREVVNKSDVKSLGNITCVHIPDFEGWYFSESISGNKPYNALQHLKSEKFQEEGEYERLKMMVVSLLDNSHPGIYESDDALLSKVKDWKVENSIEDEEWTLDDEG